MYNMIEIYEKEMNVDLNKIDNYFESAMALYEATANIYDDDADMLYEAASDVKEKIKKTFIAIIEAIKAFFKKCTDAIKDKIYEREYKKALSDYGKYLKKYNKELLRNGAQTKAKYKESMKKFAEFQTAYAKICSILVNGSKEILRAKTYEEALKIDSSVEERIEDYWNSLDKNIRDAIDILTMAPDATFGAVADISDVKRLNEELEKIMEASDNYIDKLKETAILAAEEINDDESDSTGAKKASLIQKLANKAATIAKKMGSAITNFCMKIISGIQRFVAKAKSKEGESNESISNDGEKQ